MRQRVAASPDKVRHAPRGGTPLPPHTRAAMESHFQHNFADVRVHTDAHAADAAGALAYTSGRDIVFSPGQESEALLRHELAHVVQHAHAPRLREGMSEPGDAHERDAQRMARDGGPPRVAFAPPAIMREAKSSYPTLRQREKLMPIYNPEAAESKPVTAPDDFRYVMTKRIELIISQLKVNAEARQTSPIDLPSKEIQSLGTLAWNEITKRYGAYMTKAAASRTAAEVQKDLAARVHLVSENAKDKERVACNLVVNLMDSKGADLLESYNVVADSQAAKTRACTGTPVPTPVPDKQRDQVLYESVRDDILSANKADLELIAEYGPSYAEGEQAWIQTRLIKRDKETADQALRRGRWYTFGTILHELLHSVTHPSFRTAFNGVEKTDVGIEGFAEYFAREVYNDVRSRAAAKDGDKLRLAIESTGTSFESALAEDRKGYPNYIESVNKIRGILNNEENLREAFFSGRVELLGLGNWKQPANQFGFGAYITLEKDPQAFFRVNYTRVLLGRTGRFQFGAGGDVSFLTEGSRLGFGPDLSLRYNWPYVFVGAGAGAQVSGSLKEGFGQTVRLDVLPHVDIGAHIASVRVGAGGMLLLPVAAGPKTETKTRVMLGLGVSGEF